MGTTKKELVGDFKNAGESSGSRLADDHGRWGGTKGAPLRLWKWKLQRFANRTGLSITVRRFPPGTSKWNRIEHRLFSHIAMN